MISCQQYDYIEIACMYRMPVSLHMKNGLQHTGVALDTQRDADGNECIKLQQQTDTGLIVLSEVQTLTACIDNPHFDTVSFTDT